MAGNSEYSLKRFEIWLWQNENEINHKGLKLLWHFTRIIFAVVRDVINGHITLHAMGLVYTTLLSIVPFLALSFSVLKGFGVHDQLEPMLLSAMEPIGEQRFEIVGKLISFVDNMKVGVLGSVGLGMLIYTVVSLVQKVERSFNEIWRVQNIRSLAQRFSNYLSVIMTGPLLVFAALGATAAVTSSEFATQMVTLEPLGWIFSLIGKMMPYLMIIGLFTFLYTFIPNTRVGFKYAFVGGIVAGIIWQTTGLAFTRFVAGSTQYAAIYSGFAVGIVLLIWIYLAWLILLIGASVSFYAQHAHQITRARKNVPSALTDEYTGLAIMYRVASEFDGKRGGASLTEMESELSVGPEAIQRIVDKLLRKGLLVLTGDDDNDLIPGRSLDKVTLCELFTTLRAPRYPLPASLFADQHVQEIAQLIELSHQQALGERTVLDWVRGHSVDPAECPNEG
jgi:membrane protein